MGSCARNQLPGTVSSIQLGEVMAEVEVRVGEQTVVSVIAGAVSRSSSSPSGTTFSS